MAKESTISKLKWIGVSAIISSTVTFILTPSMNYFSNKIMMFDNSTSSLYTIPKSLSLAGLVFLRFYYILRNRKNRYNDDKWRFFPANRTFTI